MTGDSLLTRLAARARVVSAAARFGQLPAVPESEPAATGNFAKNRQIWDGYSDAWDDPDFKRLNAEDQRSHAPDPTSFDVLGLEWGRVDDFMEVFREWILPHLADDVVVAEIGPGGGRVAREVVDLVQELHCFDSSPAMLRRLETTLGDRGNVTYVRLTAPKLPADATDRFDFLYVFDVFVHFDLHLLWKYLQEIDRVLKPGAVALLHTTNLRAPAGWERFAAQDEFSIPGHYFVTPDVVHALLEHTRMSVVRGSEPDDSNFYKHRDYLCLVRKSTTGG